MKDSPGFPGKPCGGEKKSQSQLAKALEAVGRSARLAARLKAKVDALPGLGRPPVAPHRPDFDEAAWRLLAAYLIEERRLIEFLLGPVVREGHDGVLRYVHATDICLDCFRTVDDQHWRFPSDDVRKELHARAGRIHVRLAHFSWTLTKPDTRLDAGDWNTKYLDQIAQGLRQFSDWLETTGRLALAETLHRSMSPGPSVDADP